MSESVRCNLHFPTSVIEVADRLAKRGGLTRKGVLIRAVGVLQAMDAATQDGAYVGVTRDRDKLDQVIVAPV